MLEVHVVRAVGVQVPPSTNKKITTLCRNFFICKMGIDWNDLFGGFSEERAECEGLFLKK